MKSKNKSTFFSIINDINFIFVIFQLLFKYIYSECEDCSPIEQCLNVCRKSVYDENRESNTYFYCNGITSSSHKYFYIYKYGDSGASCNLIEKCPDKVIAETMECVPDCLNYYEVGDFCFKPSNFEANNNLENYEPIINTGSKKKYRCKGYTYVKLIDEREFHICIDDPRDLIT